MSRILFISLFLLCTFWQVSAQSADDAFTIKKIYSTALSESNAYTWLTHLSEEIGGRLAGSPNSTKAEDYTQRVLDSLGVSSTMRQECTTTWWNRKQESEVFMYMNRKTKVKLTSTSLGNTVGTNGKEVKAQVIEVGGLDELAELGEEEINGKIVFFNRPMDPTLVNSFNAYGGAVDQRVFGASKASEYGAVAAIIRSMTNKIDDVPHTGTSIYDEGVDKIPSIAISTIAANYLSENLMKNPRLEIGLSNDNEIIPNQKNYNIIGEWKGSEFPEKIIVVGGHLDSWDLAGGAHDDGAGCVQSMAVVEIFKKMNYQPRHTIRVVLFANEENGLAGGREYARLAKENGEDHLAAIESDAGGFSPRGFSADGLNSFFDEKFKKVSDWFDLLEPYGVSLSKGGSGADIGPLKDQGPLLFGLRPDSQRYFDFHHTPDDHIGAVNKRELNLGSAAMTSLIFLIDQYGI
jgi:hypothetical protein